MLGKVVMNIENLLYEEESSTLDFKEEQYNFINEQNKYKKGELLKDILAFANAWRQTDAYILIGVREIKGSKSEVIGIKEEDNIDDASLQEFINQKTNKPIEFEYKTTIIHKKNIAYIKIPIQNRPFFINKQFGGVEANIVYIRRGSSTDKANPDEISAIGESKIKNSNRIIQNPVNYKVIAELTPIKIDREIEKDFLKKILIQIPKDIKKVTDKLENYSRGRTIFIVTTEYTNLKLYKLKLEEYETIHVKTLKNFDKYINEYKQKYFLNLFIENIGITSDTNIDININLGNGLFIKKLDMYTKYKPIYPILESSNFNEDLQSMLIRQNQLDMPNQNAYRKYKDIKEKSISVVLRDMNVGDKVLVIKDELFINISEPSLVKMNVIIKSKESSKKIVKDVELLFLNEVKILENQE